MEVMNRIFSYEVASLWQFWELNSYNLPTTHDEISSIQLFVQKK